uniref:Uncharacterized protein n=1 Tax=Solanum lycopersicum TaxID=4081 RepID=A0A3Q7J406_SOLLC
MYPSIFIKHTGLKQRPQCIDGIVKILLHMLFIDPSFIICQTSKSRLVRLCILVKQRFSPKTYKIGSWNL